MFVHIPISNFAGVVTIEGFEWKTMIIIGGIKTKLIELSAAKLNFLGDVIWNSLSQPTKITLQAWLRWRQVSKNLMSDDAVLVELTIKNPKMVKSYCDVRGIIDQHNC